MNRSSHVGLGTLNHLVNAAVIWLKLFGSHPANYAQLVPLRALPDPDLLALIPNVPAPAPLKRPSENF